MSLWIQIHLGTASYEYSGVSYWHDSHHFSLGGNEAWGRGIMENFGLTVGIGAWATGVEYNFGPIVRLWRTSSGLLEDTGNQMRSLDVSFGHRWVFPLNPYFSADILLSPTLRFSDFYDSPNLPDGSAENVKGIGAGIKSGAGIYYQPFPKIKFGASLLFDVFPVTIYKGTNYLWSPMWGQTLGVNLKLMWFP
ncbi:MAG: hypothetical protein GXO39_06600 [Thermotogae bacterium]|nr:hypothetical protein [Thermotogota bacterium]